MTTFADERELLEEVRDRLDSWLYRARERAFSELFEGPDALLTEQELRLLDRIDSRLNRDRGYGVWNADEYGIVPTGTMDEESAPRIVCTTHPQLPTEAYPGEDALDAETRTKLNDALWEYSQRIVELAQQDLEEFVWGAEVETWDD